MIVAMPWPKYANNIGMMARTCEALNIDLVVPLEWHTSITGNTCAYEIHYIKDPVAWVKQMLATRSVYAIESDGTHFKAFTPFAGNDRGNTVLLLGHESLGVPEWVLQDERLRGIISLPQHGQSPCINVAVAGSVVAYHLLG